MTVHKVNINIPTQEIGKADVVFVVKKDGSKLGELHVSNGAVVWFQSNKQYGSKLFWERLAELFEEYGTENAEKK